MLKSTDLRVGAIIEVGDEQFRIIEVTRQGAINNDKAQLELSFKAVLEEEVGR